jgi:hypothetical protein
LALAADYSKKPRGFEKMKVWLYRFFARSISNVKSWGTRRGRGVFDAIFLTLIGMIGQPVFWF